MADSLKVKLFNSASADAGLIALLKDGANPFRWFDQQLPQNWPAAAVKFPAIVVLIVSNPRTYVVTGQLPTSFVRVQFAVFGTGNDSENANDVVKALAAFLGNFSAYGLQGSVPAYANYIVGDRDSGVVQTQPQMYQRILDVQIYSNDSV